MFAKHRIKLKETQIVYECNLCKYATERKRRFKEHMDSHLGIKEHVCDACGMAFSSDHNLKGHIKWIHKEKTLQCPICGLKASVLSHLKTHIRVMHVHKEARPYKCFYCNFTCKTGGNCRKHCRNRHKGMEIKWVKTMDLKALNQEVDRLLNLNVDEMNDVTVSEHLKPVSEHIRPVNEHMRPVMNEHMKPVVEHHYIDPITGYIDGLMGEKQSMHIL
ncbi:unnamed protein product [Owenia fusiformis]|uniref:C2H2-type domain-containing protein n=1 Tax=Owenia fusiformis TaxID=6347 RepID=A0A8S4MUN2_OWEFU|nr:unnamed protein product [Owenia fusiformis]